MTRINCVPVKELHNKHLVAEYHELPRVFGIVRTALDRGRDPANVGAPAEYTLGEGHVKFFYTRLGYLLERQAELVIEMMERKMKPKMPDIRGLAVGIPASLLNSWMPTDAAMALNRARLAERLAVIEAKKPRPVPSHKD